MPDYSDIRDKSREKKENFLALLDPVYDALEGYACAMVRDDYAANDLVSETILQGFERFESIRDPRAFLGFLITIASRLHKRRRWRGRRFSGFADGEEEALRGESLP